MKELKRLWIIPGVLSGLLMVQSCNRDEMIQENKETLTTSKDYLAIVDAFSLLTEDEVTSTETGDEKSAAIITGCLAVKVHDNEDGAFWPRSWTLDYGTENCECFSGNTKRGMIHVSLSDWWRNEGSLREITFEDFYLNNNRMEGVKTILNTGLNEEGNLTFTRKVKDASLTYPDSKKMTWKCEKFSELIEGGQTILFADDVWSVTGGGSGINLDGKAYTMKITKELIYKNGCFHPVSGVVEITTEGEPLKVIDYGTGACDNLAEVTTGDVKETVEL